MISVIVAAFVKCVSDRGLCELIDNLLRKKFLSKFEYCLLVALEKEQATR